ncbi:MAG: GGDEF domain-containing protein [Bdellovibrionales bacterium]|nr:GGDEF domain-containing protein [Bdellovibrionales bacterium]
MADEDNKDDFADKTSILQSDTFKLRIAEAGQAPPSIVLLVGPASAIGRQWPLEDTDRIIGRSPNSHIFVDDRSVSKSHAKILLEGGDVSILDLESTNKTVINGQMINPLQPVKLNNNDQIKVGNVIFKYLEKGNLETVASAATYDRGQTDALTGIANRGALDAKGPELFKRSELLGIPLSIITFDIDHFKKVNDTYGHPAGDYVLKEISKIISTRLIRGNDFFARSGGEEFVLLLLGSNLKTAEEVAERIRQTLESHHFEFESKDIPITISAGVAIKNESDEAWDSIYDRSDKALYHSKNSGRNMVAVAE